MLYFPQQIKEIIGNQKYDQNNIGMSESTVLMFSEYVLKIQKRSLETDNEYEVCRNLQGQIPIPEIPVYCIENDIAYTLMTRVSGKMLCDEEYLYAPQRLIDLVAQGLHTLWRVETAICPDKVSRLDARLKRARFLVEHNLGDSEDVAFVIISSYNLNRATGALAPVVLYYPAIFCEILFIL